MQTQPPNYSLLTDLYQLTMAYGYWRSGAATTEAVFHLHFRKNPFQGGFSIAAGLEAAIGYLENLRFDDRDAAYLSGLNGNDGEPLFEPAFIKYLQELKFSCDVDAIPEGTAVFPGEPLLRVRGPIIEAQIVETALLNLINFQTLIATKAARVCSAADGDPVIEFGLRRAQGVDGSLSASRAAFIGGCTATSNVLAGKLFGIPVKGTHAHSWVMSFDSELEAFEKYADAMPNNCVFLVDTYDTLQGVRNAVTAGKRLRERGFEMNGIRLDSGDLAKLSVESRKILDEGGFPQAFIIASNDLDEYGIQELKQRGATIGVWGVGTNMVTAFDQPALGGVYKLAAIRQPGGNWQYKIKLSEQPIKMSTPGIQQVRRFYRNGEFCGDAIYDSASTPPSQWTIVPTSGAFPSRTMPNSLEHEDLLVPIFRSGKLVYQSSALPVLREHAQQQIQKLPSAVKRLKVPEEYVVGLEDGLHQFKMSLIQQLRSKQKSS